MADLTPKGLEAFPLKQGLTVSVEGECRPSEIKVTCIVTEGGTPVLIEHKKPNHGPGQVHPAVPANVARVLASARSAGWTPGQEPRRRPKHFEVLACQNKGPWTELHIDFAGTIYKSKPADMAKWTAEA